jgi:hypothetical protein
MPGLLTDLQMPAQLPEVFALTEQPFARTKLADHLLGCMPSPCHESSPPRPNSGASDSERDWPGPEGSRQSRPVLGLHERYRCICRPGIGRPAPGATLRPAARYLRRSRTGSHSVQAPATPQGSVGGPIRCCCQPLCVSELYGRLDAVRTAVYNATSTFTDDSGGHRTIVAKTAIH